MGEIAACTLIQEEPDRKTERYMMMFKDYPDVVSVDILQEMLGICRKNAYLLVKQNKIHSARVGRSYKIPKLCVVEYLMMFKDYPDVVSVDILQEMLGICRKNAYLLVKQNKIHSARVGRSYKIPKLCVVEYLIDQNRQLGGMRLSNSLAPSLQNTPESSKLMMPKQRTFGCEQKGA